MAFSDFKHIDQVLSTYPLRVRAERFLPDSTLELPPLFQENLNFVLDRRAADESESFVRESLMYPFLQLAWRRHPRLKLWLQPSLIADDNLQGEPDYLLAVLPDEVITKLINKPLLAAVEAKKQDFTQGWAQCLAEMLACQKNNGSDQITVYGIVSTGFTWEFGKLTQNTFVRDPRAFSLTEPSRLFGVLDHVFGECERQAFAV